LRSRKNCDDARFASDGLTTVHPLMQACGRVNDHLVGCAARAAASGR
jgi:3-methyladenine DNA glycosylase Tag